MAESRRSALAHLRVPEGEPRDFTMTELRPASIVQVAAWPGTLPTVETAIAALIGVGPKAVGSAASDPNVTVATLSPGRFLIAGAAPDLCPRFEGALLSSEAAVTDLSHARTILRLEGARVSETLAKCVAIDLHPTVFPPGRVAQTMIHHVDVVLHRQGLQSYDVWALRSFAEAVVEWILDAGRVT